MKRSRITALALALVMALALAAPAVAAEYTVVKGDSLSKIAQKTWGNASRWKEIYEANKDTVKHPNKIYVGQTLTIPEETPGPVAPAERTLYADAAGYEEDETVTVSITVVGDKITAASASSTHDSPFGIRALTLMPKAMVEQNTVNVDAISGATATSIAIQTAAQKIMAQLVEEGAGMADLDSWALANGYVKASKYDIVTGVDAITGASDKELAPEVLLTQEETKALILDYLRGWPLKTGENGETIYSYREMYQIATSYNNVPGLSSVEFVIDTKTMKLYAASDRGTEKGLHIRHNPNVTMFWYHQIPEEEYVAYSNDYFNSYGVQIKGTAKIMDPASPETRAAADLYIETLYGAESWNARSREDKDKVIDMLLKSNDWIEVSPEEYIAVSLLWVYNKENSSRPEYYDPDSPYFGKSTRQVYYVNGQ